jgi:hypothetical protein
MRRAPGRSVSIQPEAKDTFFSGLHPGAAALGMALLDSVHKESIYPRAADFQEKSIFII